MEANILGRKKSQRNSNSPHLFFSHSPLAIISLGPRKETQRKLKVWVEEEYKKGLLSNFREVKHYQHKGGTRKISK